MVFVLSSLPPMETQTARAHGPANARIEVLGAAIAREPTNVAFLVERGDLYREIGELSPALADYERALRLDPSREILHLACALAFVERGERADALVEVNTSINLDPDDSRAWRVRARVLSGLGRIAEAVSSYDRAIALVDTPLPDDYLQRAVLLDSLGPSSLDAAVAGLDEGVARLGPVFSLQLLAIDLERRRGTYDGALARLDGIERHYARMEFMLALRGDILAEAGRDLQAAAAYADALQAIEERLSRRPATPAMTRLKSELMHKLVK